jgi:hypothetical protein
MLIKYHNHGNWSCYDKNAAVNLKIVNISLFYISVTISMALTNTIVVMIRYLTMVAMGTEVSC